MAGLFGGSPKPTPPARMPDQEDASVKRAQERQRRAIASRSGRASTILTDGGGGSAYSNTSLGQA